MKHSLKAAGILAALSLGVATAVLAHPGQGQMGSGHAMYGGMGHRGMGGEGAGRMGGQQLMTPEERSAMMEKMRSANTPEERQKLAEANRQEMQKRATERGFDRREGCGPRAGAASGSTTQTR